MIYLFEFFMLQYFEVMKLNCSFFLKSRISGSLVNIKSLFSTSGFF